jgi:hypothetical protein
VAACANGANRCTDQRAINNTIAQANGRPDSSSDTYAHTNSEADACAYACPDSGAYADPDPDADSIAGPDSVTLTGPNRYAVYGLVDWRRPQPAEQPVDIWGERVECREIDDNERSGPVHHFRHPERFLHAYCERRRVRGGDASGHDQRRRKRAHLHLSVSGRRAYL